MTLYQFKNTGQHELYVNETKMKAMICIPSCTDVLVTKFYLQCDGRICFALVVLTLVVVLVLLVFLPWTSVL